MKKIISILIMNVYRITVTKPVSTSTPAFGIAARQVHKNTADTVHAEKLKARYSNCV